MMKVEMQEQIHTQSLPVCVYLVGELLIMCKVRFGGVDVGLVNMGEHVARACIKCSVRQRVTLD